MVNRVSPFGPISQLADDLRSGKRPLLPFIDELAAYYTAREPEVLAFLPELGRFDRLRREAQALLDQYPDPEKRPLLFGVPFGVKDIFHVDGFETRAGSQLPPSLLGGTQAASVTVLKQAGGLMMGKTVTTEFAYFAPGPTRNPHNPQHTPGGSSSGSAAAVAAGLVPLAFGTQTIGSINRPAAYCGTVGYKPSYDRISRDGVIPLSVSVDHVGLFAPDVGGIELAASLLCRLWQEVLPGAQPVLGVPEGPFLDRATPMARAHFRAMCKKLHAAGFAVQSVLVMPDFDKIYDHHQAIVAADAAQFHQPWFEAYGELYHEKTAALLSRGRQVGQRQLKQALKGRLKLREGLSQQMLRHGIDIWLSPPAPGPAPLGLASTGDPVMNLPWTHAGLPTLTLPAGVDAEGLPMGVQLTGRWYEDEALLAWAAELAPILAS